LNKHVANESFNHDHPILHPGPELLNMNLAFGDYIQNYHPSTTHLHTIVIAHPISNMVVIHYTIAIHLGINHCQEQAEACYQRVFQVDIHEVVSWCPD